MKSEEIKEIFLQHSTLIGVIATLNKRIKELEKELELLKNVTHSTPAQVATDEQPSQVKENTHTIPEPHPEGHW